MTLSTRQKKIKNKIVVFVGIRIPADNTKNVVQGCRSRYKSRQGVVASVLAVSSRHSSNSARTGTTAARGKNTRLIKRKKHASRSHKYKYQSSSVSIYCSHNGDALNCNDQVGTLL